ncbi:FUSC family protein [Pelomonas sp. CA6]|uniref:FUSC family protein n=1 Tax=Pelomonas sp. CA6 TaxID=2907999 RepID=UPI001F4C0A68|nr:FUSC family protein [Pelomonas sp. CA6]MCH7343211.1 FUSC family protein [Pelomonas sp. CA6]
MGTPPGTPAGLRARTRRWPAHVWNGLSVALGVALVHALVAALWPGAQAAMAAQLAMAAAIVASLADTPGHPRRNLKRVATGGLLALGSSVLATLLDPWAAAVALLVGGVGLVGALCLSWGLRAAAVSFAPILALVFALSWPALPWPLVLGACGTGVLLYLGWAGLSSRLLQRRYRVLALAQALDGLAQLLTGRAALLSSGGGAAAMNDWLGNESQLAEQLQAARDLLFPDAQQCPREAALLLHAIELRDLLLASRLDLELLGEDPVGQRLRDTLVQRLRDMALTLQHCRDALLDGRAAPAPVPRAPDWQALPPQDTRQRLQLALQDRLRHLDVELNAMVALLDPSRPPPPLPLEAAQLRQFTAPEGWPLAALSAQLHLDSPVLRHALRSALALSCAYAIALVLPWASHPHWLVLSVAVVLRGSLDQTLARRNLRVAGTVLGCALVLALAQIPSPWLWALVLQACVGLAHAYVSRRYLITATAATIMALLQAHLANPTLGLAIGERLADTVLGAALAWGFSYVLPAWERRNLPRAVLRTRAALQRYAELALIPAEGMAQRLARRQAYDALDALSAALKRSGAEPRRVQPPQQALNTLLDHGYRLMAHLSMVRQSLLRRSDALGDIAQRLPTHSAALQRALAGQEPVPHPIQALQDWSLLPMSDPGTDLRPWLLRRLKVSLDDAARAGQAAEAALQQLRD